MIQLEIVEINPLLHVAPEIPEVMKFLGGFHRVRQMIERIQQHAHRNFLPGEGHHGVRSLAQSFRSLKTQIGRVRSGQQQAHRAQRQHLPRRGERAQRGGIIAFVGVNHAAIGADNQYRFRIGLARVGFGPRGFFVGQNAPAGEVQSNFAAFVGSDERRLPVGLFHQQSVADGFQAHGFDLLQASGPAHRVQRQVDALPRG